MLSRQLICSQVDPAAKLHQGSQGGLRRGQSQPQEGEKQVNILYH